ncbi:1-phosphofructokinase family hexose kinase [Microvirga massiliensis]|uniref:1-phosphofructokinase family hexose kinase n=1 Tax=Microvirga massiliensis TaxID=1033741 RepID=UPI00062BF09E|nr:1-phosphofructokinase family hexose kinase [Microvirga massiliensis]
MKPILTLTLNPSIDGSSEAETVRPIRKIRTTNERFDPGGGGINVSRVIRELGGASHAIYLSGGATGPILEDILQHRGIAGRRIPIGDHTRVSHAVFERSTGLEYRFVPEGPEVRPEEWQNCLAALEEFDFDYLVASGSLPRGVPADFYCRVAALTGRKKAKFVLDTSGDALRETLSAGDVYLVKPSLGELEQLVGRPLRESGAIEEAAMHLVRDGSSDLIAVTMGHEGAILVQTSGAMRLPALEVEVHSAVGAGDSFLAAMTLALAQGATPEFAFRRGVAAGAAAVLTPGTELCKREAVDRLFAQLPG